MAKRLTARLSAGAALVTGLGLAGIAVSLPAQADSTDLVYKCTTPLGEQNFSISLSATDTDTATVGDTVTLTPTGTLTLNSDIANGMAGFLGWHHVEGEANDVTATVSNGTEKATTTTDLSITRTHIFDGTTWIQDDTPELPITGTGGEVVAEQAGTYTVSAPDTFDATFRGFDADEQPKGDPVDSTCTYASGDKVIDTLTVEEEDTTPDPSPSDDDTTPDPSPSDDDTTPDPSPSDDDTTPAPEVNDWFNEPGSLPITDDGKSFTVEGTADQAGVVSVVLLDESKQVLRTITWNVTEGSNTRDFPFAEGTDYVRLISEDCVDANGNDGSVAGGCNVEYYAPWVNPDSDDDNSGDDDGAGSGSAGPETPGVVQTDGFTRVEEPAGTNSAALLLGGALLAGAGAGSVVLVRRRQAAQH